MPANNHLHLSKKVVITERIDSKTGHIIRRTVETPLIGARQNGAERLRKEMIDRITKMVQDLELEYARGDWLIKRLKNFKVNATIDKRLRKKQFIEDRTNIERKFDYKRKVSPDKETLGYQVDVGYISILEEILQNIDSLKLDERWKSEIIDRHDNECLLVWQNWPKHALKEERWRKEITKNNARLRRWFEKWDEKYGENRTSWMIKDIPIKEIADFYKQKCAETETKDKTK